MNTRSRFLLVPALLLLLGQGCGGSTPPTPPGTPTPVTTQPTPPAQVLGCNHPFLPLTNGYEVTYKTNNPNTRGYTMKVTSALQNQANLSYIAGDVFVAHVIRCQNGELNEDSYLDLSRFFVRGAQDVQVSARRLEGTLLPRELQVGTRWTSAFEGNANTQQAGGATSNVKVSATKEATGIETVTTAAGTFPNALKVKGTYVIKTKLLAPVAMDLPDLTFEGTEWWVEGKGLVKSVSGFGGQTVNVEAERIVTP